MVLTNGEEGASLAGDPFPAAPLEDGVVAVVDVALVEAPDDEVGAGVDAAAEAAALRECRTYFAESLSISCCSSILWALEIIILSPGESTHPVRAYLAP